MTSAIPADNLRHLVRLRHIAIAGQLSAVAVAAIGLRARLPLSALLTVICLLLLANIATWTWLRGRNQVSPPIVFAHLLVDTAALTALLFLTGGADNPFSGLYLLTVVIAAIALPRAYAWSVAGVTAACYAALFFLRLPLLGTDGNALAGHVIQAGGWLTYVLGAALITYFVAAITATLRDRDQQLADAKLAALTQEGILQVGALAASATHELSSPLSTMAVVVKDLQLEGRHIPAFRASLAILATQIDVCRKTLSNLMAAAGHVRLEGGHRIAVDEFLSEIVSKCRLLHSAARIECRLSVSNATPDIVGEQILSQAILNLLNNAVDASPQSVVMDASWIDDTLRITINDCGAGLPPEALDKIGKEFFTTKALGQGNGLGVMLSNTIIGRFGGTVSVLNRPEGGTCAQVVLPLAPLLATRVTC